MSGVIFEYNDEDLQKTLSGLVDRIRDNRAALRGAGAILRESIRSNFAAGGRPKRWRPLRYRDGQPLRDTGGLQSSITSHVRSEHLVVVGTNKKYAAVHNFGAKRGAFGTVLARVGEHQRVSRQGKRYTVRAHTRKQQVPWGDIPAREFMVVQDEDRVEIAAVLADYIMEDKA